MTTGEAFRAASWLAALLALGAPGTGHAAPTGRYVAYSADVDSPCRLWATTASPPVSGDWVGVMTLDYVVPVNRPGYMPLVRCDLVYDAVPWALFGPASAMGVAALAGPVVLGDGSGFFTPEYVAASTLCTGISDDGGTTWNETDCRPATVVAVDDALDAPATVLDPVVCPIATSLAAEVNQLPPSVARIDPASGDVYMGGFRVYDCPPHGS